MEYNHSHHLRRIFVKTVRTWTMFVLVCSGCLCLRGQSLASLTLSHDSTVKITSQPANSSGSGFFIGGRTVITCFHVISVLSHPRPEATHYEIDGDIQVTFPSGEMIRGDVVSLPTDQDSAPLQFDFAVIRLDHYPDKRAVKAVLANADEKPKLGDDVVFSGYPLATPGMVTHRGMVSGMDDAQTLIFVEAPINRGNSGGALIDSEGHVIGLISMKEGGISPQLEGLRTYIKATAGSGQVRIMGVDPLQSTNAIIDTLDQYISTGIGYARSIRFARDYLEKHPEMMK